MPDEQQHEHEVPAQPETEASPAQPEKRRQTGWIVTLALLLVAALVALAAVLFWPRSDDADQLAPTTPDSETPATPELPDGEDTDPEPEPETPVAPANLTLPTCDVLNPWAQQATDDFVAILGTPDALTPPPGETGRDSFDRNFGPMAQATMADASALRGCYYVFSFHDALYQFAAQITPEDAQPLVDALKADSRFTASTSGNATLYVATETVESPAGSYVDSTGHAFLGNAWVSASGVIDVTSSLEAGLDALVAANPSL